MQALVDVSVWIISLGKLEKRKIRTLSRYQVMESPRVITHGRNREADE